MATTLTAHPRVQFGSANARRLRRQGRIPGLVAEPDGTSINLEVDYVQFVKAYNEARKHKPVHLEFEGKVIPVLISQFSIEPVSKRPSHVDFYRISPGRRVTADIPVRLEGTSPGVRRGGILEFIAQSLRVRCSPDILPEEFVIDISKLDVENAVYVRDIEFPPNVANVLKGGQCIVRVTSSRATKMAEADARPDAKKKK